MKISKIDKILNYIENNYEIELNFETLFYKLDIIHPSFILTNYAINLI